MFLRYVGIYLRVSTAPKPRKTSSPSPPWKPKILHLKHLIAYIGPKRISPNLNFVSWPTGDPHPGKNTS
jgi:hypothetical protein